MTDRNRISSVPQLESILGSPNDFVRRKIALRLAGGRQLASVVGARSETEIRESAARLEALYSDGLY